MKANEFVKKFGLDAAKDILRNKRSWIDKKSGRKLTDNSFVLKSKTYEYAIGTLYMGNFSDYDENSYRVDEVNLLLLKRLVESHELVMEFGGLDRVKKALDGKHVGYTHFYLHSNDRYVFLDNYVDFIPDQAQHIGMFNKAISDVESCS